MQLIEIVGYAGSVLVAVSLMMSAVVKLRVINFVGAFIFSVYGFMIGALPVGFLNGFIAIVDAYYLIEIFSAKEFFKIFEPPAGSDYVKYFLEFHEADIKKFFPAFDFKPSSSCQILFILRNSVPAGLVCAEQIGSDSLYIKLDYAIPGYRDFKLGRYVYNKHFKETGIKQIYTDLGNAKHNSYLEKMGYIKSTLNGREMYLLNLGAEN